MVIINCIKYLLTLICIEKLTSHSHFRAFAISTDSNVEHQLTVAMLKQPQQLQEGIWMKTMRRGGGRKKQRRRDVNYHQIIIVYDNARQ